MSEHDEQSALFQWARLQENQYPGLELLHAIPNGGHRHKSVAVKMQQEGVKAGVPDICLPVPRNIYHGLYIEMKFGKNQPTEHQNYWLEQLSQQGYFTAVCYGMEEAKSLIIDYLENDLIFDVDGAKGY